MASIEELTERNAELEESLRGFAQAMFDAGKMVGEMHKRIAELEASLRDITQLTVCDALGERIHRAQAIAREVLRPPVTK